MGVDQRGNKELAPYPDSVDCLEDSQFYPVVFPISFHRMAINRNFTGKEQIWQNASAYFQSLSFNLELFWNILEYFGKIHESR